MRLNPRVVYAAIFLLAAGMIGFGLYLQEYKGLEPCPMCILQRFAFIGIGAVALVAAIHGPARTGRKVYAALLVLVAIAGAGVAIRHSWLQLYPPKMETCGSDLDFLVNNFPLAEALPKIFAGTGSCSKVDWTLLGLTIPNWALVWYAIFAGLAIWAAMRKA